MAYLSFYYNFFKQEWHTIFGFCQSWGLLQEGGTPVFLGRKEAVSPWDGLSLLSMVEGAAECPWACSWRLRTQGSGVLLWGHCPGLRGCSELPGPQQGTCGVCGCHSLSCDYPEWPLAPVACAPDISPFGLDPLHPPPLIPAPGLRQPGFTVWPATESCISLGQADLCVSEPHFPFCIWSLERAE